LSECGDEGRSEGDHSILSYSTTPSSSTLKISKTGRKKFVSREEGDNEDYTQNILPAKYLRLLIISVSLLGNI
jgi:hypothetical protein